MSNEEINNKVFDLLEKTGLNWTVNRLPLFTMNMLPTESFGIFRNDNNKWLGTVGPRYREMQNHSLAETIIRASENVGISMDRGGLLNGGQRIFLQAALPDEVIGRSGVRRLITAINSHDGSTSIAFGSTNTVIVCENTFFRAYGELHKFRHTESAEKRIEIAMKDLQITLEQDQKLMDKFKIMAETEVNEDIIQRVIGKVFGLDVTKETKEISSRKRNQILAFGNATRKSFEEQGETVWGLFNAVTRYTNHMQGHTSESQKLEYIMAGTGYETANKSFNEIMDWIDKNTEKTPKVYAQV